MYICMYLKVRVTRTKWVGERERENFFVYWFIPPMAAMDRTGPD